MTQSTPSTSTNWWEMGVIYQIYPFTYADANQDGTGDLRGIIQRLDYLNDGNLDSNNTLGIDAIWLSPVHPSPMVDNGYDVCDYRDICPIFGRLEDFDELLEKAHQRGIKIILDLVVNHTSEQHPWFIESASSKDNPKADWYLWHTASDDQEVPNNWQSYLDGTGWQYHSQRQAFYFHTFTKQQPDLNWKNADVRAAVFDIVRYWLDRGVDGFRLDASSVYSKDPEFRDNPLKYGADDEDKYDSYHHLYEKNLPENHQIIREIRAILDEYGDRVLIGETFIDSRLSESVTFYGVEQDELHLPITFEFPFSPWYPGYLQREIEKIETMVPPGSWPTYFLDNHDLPRHLSRWINCSLCVDTEAIAKAAATLLLTLRGTPLLYYGQELGMVDNTDIPKDRIQDNVMSGTEEPPRDGARTPMQWDDSAHAGFSFGEDVEPYLPVHPNYEELNVKNALAQPDSILNFYRRLLRIRKKSQALQRGSWRTLIHYPHEHLAYVRELEAETVLIAINFAAEQPFKRDIAISPDGWTVLLSTHHKTGLKMALTENLQPFEVSIFQHFDAS